MKLAYYLKDIDLYPIENLHFFAFTISILFKKIKVICIKFLVFPI